MSQFDVRALNEHLDQSKRQRKVAFAIFLPFLAAVAILLIVSIGPRVVDGTATYVQIAILVVGVGALIGIIAMVLHRTKWMRAGAVAVSVSPEGLGVEYPNLRVESKKWSEAGFRLELHDFSKISRDQWLVETPFFMIFDEVQTALSAEAYAAIISQVRLTGLADRVGPADRRYAPAEVTVHVVTGRSG